MICHACLCRLLLARDHEVNSAAVAESQRLIGHLKSELDNVTSQSKLELMNKEFQWGQCELELRQTIANLKNDLAKVNGLESPVVLVMC